MKEWIIDQWAGISLDKSLDIEMLSQEWETYLIKGLEINRIRYGSETENKGLPSRCSLCEVRKGMLHILGCGKEYCPACDKIAIKCDCEAMDD